MSNPVDQRRLIIRLAIRLHERLQTPQFKLIELPNVCWQECQRLSRLYQKALGRGWFAAAAIVRTRLKRVLRNCEVTLSGWLVGLTPQPNQSSRLSLAELVKELRSLETEFPGVEFDLRKRTISVTTDTIILEDVYLGPFRIELTLSPNIDGLGYAVTAIDPQPSTNDEEVTHPHVREGGLCEGEGTVPIRKALTDGRIGDFFQIVQQILLTYNAGSAYVPLSDWHGIACTACGASTADDDRTRCHSTSEPICLDCAVTCADCGHDYMPDCTTRCEECERNFCHDC